MMNASRITYLFGLEKSIERNKIIQILAIVSCWALMISNAMAELRIDSVYPSLVKIGGNTEITILGEGFDQNTRVSIFWDTVNEASIIGSVDIPDTPYDVAVSGTVAYVAADSAGLQIIDISDPTAPTIIGSVCTPGFTKDLAVSGTMALVIGSSGFQIIDISDPTAPTIIGSVDQSGYPYGEHKYRKVAISGTIAYITDNYFNRLPRLHIFDISDPTAPAFIDTLFLPGSLTGNVTISDDHLFIANYEEGICVIDISNPLSPAIIGSVDTPGHAFELAISGDMAIVADGKTGLVIVPMTVEIASVNVSSSNKMTYTLPDIGIEGNYNLWVFNKNESIETIGAVTLLNSLDDIGGYALTTDLWAMAVLEVLGSPVSLVWKMVGADTTPSGDRVVSGYFYASPNDFPYGSPYNPEVFVKVYIATNGWANMAFNHVTVDAVQIRSAHHYHYGGSADQSAAATLDRRLVEHSYTGVGLQ